MGIHGLLDTVVPVQNGIAMLRACDHCAVAPFFLSEYGHNDIPSRPCFAGIKLFMDMIDQAAIEDWSLEIWRGRSEPKDAACNALSLMRIEKPLDYNTSPEKALHFYTPHPYTRPKIVFLLSCFMAAMIGYEEPES